MNYTISTTKRNLMILSAAFLIVYTLYNAFYFNFFIAGHTNPDPVQVFIRGIVFTIPYAYLVWMLFVYFRHHQWKALQTIMLVILGFEILTTTFITIVLIGNFGPVNFFYSEITGVFWVLAILIQAVFLLLLSRKEHPEVFALQKYGIALILFQVIAFGIPVLFRSESVSSMILVIRILSAIPYLFLLEFTLKLKSKEAMVSESRVNP